MSFSWPVLLLPAILFLFSACNEPIQELPKLEIHLTNSQPSKYALLYGFMGDKQIQIDTLHLVNGSAEYLISEKCNTGVYRLIFESQVALDFVFENEDLDIQLNEASFPEQLQERKSKNNAFFLAFAADLRKLQGYIDSEPSDTLNAFVAEYYQKTLLKYKPHQNTNNSLAKSVASLLACPNYQLHTALNPQSPLSEEAFMVDSYLKGVNIADERLLATPYLYVLSHNYLSFFKDEHKAGFSAGCEALLKKSQGADAISAFVRGMVYEAAFENGAIAFIKDDLAKRYGDDICIRTTTELTTPFIAGGAKLPQLLADRLGADNKDYWLVLFEKDGCAANLKLNNMLVELSPDLSLQNIYLKRMKGEDVSGVLDSLHVVCYPSLLVVNGDGTLLSRWYGVSEIEAVIRSTVSI